MATPRNGLAPIVGLLVLAAASVVWAQEPRRPGDRPAGPGRPEAGAPGPGEMRRDMPRPDSRPLLPSEERRVAIPRASEGMGVNFFMRSLAMFDTNGDGVLSHEEYDAGMKELFSRLDANGDGKIDHGEMNRDMSRVFVAPTTRSRQLLRLYDQNKDGKITPDECLLPPKAFAEIDRNKDGALDSEELAKMSLSEAALLQDPARRAAALLAELDKNGDKTLTFEEFELGKAVFKQCDRNADGVLDAGELKLLPPLPLDSPQRRAEDAIARLDQDGDKMLSQNEFRVPGARFEELDVNKDGLVDLKEMVVWFESGRGQSFGIPAGAEIADRMLEQFDKNGDGKIDKDELEGLPEAMWRRWDLNADGVVEGAEIEKAVESMRGGRMMNVPGGPGFGGIEAGGPGTRGPRGELMRGNPQETIKALDKDGDGKLTAAELGVDPRIFQRIDRDGDGKVTAEELAGAQELLRVHGPEMRDRMNDHNRRP